MEKLWLLLQDGGPILGILLVLSFLALVVIFLKMFQFSRLRLKYQARLAEDVIVRWRRGESDQALALLQKSAYPVTRVMEHTLHQLRQGIPAEKIREESVRVAANQLQSLSSYLRTLDAIANLSPLLGLLGTVLGMISVFQKLQIDASQVHPGLLAGGIWEALLTTAAGLAIAIPAAAAHLWLESIVERQRHQMEDAVTRLFTQSTVEQP